jgi:hypothetical protein
MFGQRLHFSYRRDGTMTRPNKTLQATAAALCAATVALNHNPAVAEVSALPAAVPELGR